MGAVRAQRTVDGRGHALGGMEVGIVQYHADGVHLLQVERHRPLHQRPAGNARGGGVVELLGVAPRGGHVAAQHQGSLRLGVDLPVRPVERGHQQDASFERSRIAGRGNRYVHLVAGAAEGRQRGHHKHRGHIFDLHVVGAVGAGLGHGDAHALQRRDQRLRGKNRLLAVPGAAQPDHQPVADQLVVANSLDGGHILDARQLGRSFGANRGGSQRQDHGQRKPDAEAFAPPALRPFPAQKSHRYSLIPGP